MSECSRTSGITVWISASIRQATWLGIDNWRRWRVAGEGDCYPEPIIIGGFKTHFPSHRIFHWTFNFKSGELDYSKDILRQLLVPPLTKDLLQAKTARFQNGFEPGG